MVVATGLCEQGGGVIAKEVLCDVQAEQGAGFAVDRGLHLVAVDLMVPLAQEIKGLCAVGVGWLDLQKGFGENLGGEGDAFGVDGAHIVGGGRAFFQFENTALDTAGAVVWAKGQADIIRVVGVGDALVAGDGVAGFGVNGLG